jgi:hypothetical protein
MDLKKITFDWKKIIFKNIAKESTGTKEISIVKRKSNN